MSSVDPFAALFAQNAAEAALADLTLGIPVELLQIQLNVGDMLAATVLPPQNGHDLLEILGQRIVAELPPTVKPGDTLLLEVTGSSGNRVLVSNLGAIDPEQPLPAAVLQAANVLEKSAEAPAPAITQAQEDAAPQSAPEQKPSPPVAPSRAVFVAASVVRSNAVAPDSTATAAAALQVKAAAIEARIAAARAAATEAAPAAQAPSASTPPVASAKVPVHVSVAQAASPRIAAATGNAPERLLQTLRIPLTTATLAAARIAGEAVRRLPEVLTRLEQALSTIASDARAATLRNVCTFVARIDPSNEAALQQQIASYVSHVADGPEHKVVQLLQALAHTGDEAKSVPNAVAQAKVIEREVSAEHDLKSLVLSLLRRPPLEHTPQLAQALRDAAVTLTGAQLQNLQNATQSPSVISLALPVFYKENGQPAQLRIDRKSAGNGSASLDGDNFHVAFVLDTAALGTVAIDVQASNRSVSVNVRTENERTVPAFKTTLSDLVGRLERLRYRVARASAETVPRATLPPKRASAPDRGLDLRA